MRKLIDMKLLVTGAAHFSEMQLQSIEKLGFENTFLQNEADELPIPYDQVETVICNGLFLYHDISKFANLRYIQLTSAGYDRVSLDYIDEHGIAICNARGVYSIPMAEYVIASVLQIYKRSDFFKKNQNNHSWNKHRDLKELFGKKICIVGCGSVGTECAKRFVAFDCEVIGIDLIPKELDFYKKIYPISELNEVVLEADIIVLTLPLTEQTKHLFNYEILQNIKDEAVIVNVARGAIIDTKALIEIMNQKKMYAVLDVFEEEPLPPESPLWEMENVILTPHNSFVSNNNTDRLYQVVLNNLTEWSK